MIVASVWSSLESLNRGELRFEQFVKLTGWYWERVAMQLTRRHRVSLSGVDFLDVYQMLLIGLWESTLGNYDPARGPFPSYAYRLAIYRAEKRINQALRRSDSMKPSRDVMRAPQVKIREGADDDEPSLQLESQSVIPLIELRMHSQSVARRAPDLASKVAHVALERSGYDPDTAVSLILADRSVAKTVIGAKMVVRRYIEQLTTN
jgi:hypothetical protein